MIGGIHKTDMAALRWSESRNEVKLRREEREKNRVEDAKKNQVEANATSFEEETEKEVELKRKDDDEWRPEEAVIKVRQRNTHRLENTALACDRVGISSRSAAVLCNSYAMDMGWLTRENRLTDTLDKSKLDKWRAKERRRIKAEEEKKNVVKTSKIYLF